MIWELVSESMSGCTECSWSGGCKSHAVSGESGLAGLEMSRLQTRKEEHLRGVLELPTGFPHPFESCGLTAYLFDLSLTQFS